MKPENRELLIDALNYAIVEIESWLPTADQEDLDRYQKRIDEFSRLHDVLNEGGEV